MFSRRSQSCAQQGSYDGLNNNETAERAEEDDKKTWTKFAFLVLVMYLPVRRFMINRNETKNEINLKYNDGVY